MEPIFTRSVHNPILKPNIKNDWESEKLYNPGVVFHNGKYHMFYRAVGKGDNWKSAIGYAVSKDGVNFKRFNKPILTGRGKLEKRGVEDPRITKIGDTFFMTFAAYDGITPRLNIATSKDLTNWKKRGRAFIDWNFKKAGGIYTEWDENGNFFIKPKLTEWSKSGGIFSEKINENFLMLFGEHRIWFASSNNGVNWIGDQEPFLKPRAGKYFDNIFVEMGPPPIKTDKGWLVLYHGVNEKHCYQIGFLLLDLRDPRKILFRSKKPIFKPEKRYELSGIVDVLPGGLEKMQEFSDKELKEFLVKHKAKGTMPQVVFCCGAILMNNVLQIFYGAGDSVICAASADIDDIFKSLMN